MIPCPRCGEGQINPAVFVDPNTAKGACWYCSQWVPTTACTKCGVRLCRNDLAKITSKPPPKPHTFQPGHEEPFGI